ncbi:hypothetical protein [Staphylococcus saprophyticus]|uniref:hypothetical protein n=1 Tax=Staphylococcus saprophyticus TaxID=29385 RepID=UPI0022EB637B|nr:hypothetical protein [Staphylococcus saprophyticus]MDW4225825.1 hypothetical protein [Staphylococcus saprophyticus]MDW4246584.1 hypothetical protein [Staphylococcus saprophyticus]MDW4258929.1 hypothetical protein [Staphylococcus saprophyticus]MDW4324130.1 hypothetical protein [Staphylococcus saprophyticus]MDW4331836.1 hypothetical protein [Staphylococcus saprophyticus]
MLKAKALIIGKSPYNKKNIYYSNIKLKNYPTKNVAFLPLVYNDTYNKNSIITYRRIISFIKGELLTCEKINQLSDPRDIAKDFMEKDIFFINQSEFKIDENKSLIIGNNGNTELKYDKDTEIYCFGSDAIKKFKNHTYLNKVHNYPHPSPRNNHPFWEKYDNGYSSQNYTENDKFNPSFLINTLK